MGSQRSCCSKRVPSAALLLAAFVGATSCASGGGGSSTGGSMDEITFEQVQDANVANAMQVVQRLRPRWLRPVRGNASFRGPIPEAVVFLDGVRFGGLSSLADINAAIVQRMEYLTATEATTLYGTGYMGGAIRVFTLRP